MGVFRKSDPGNNLTLGLESDPKSKHARLKIYFTKSYIENFIEKKSNTTYFQQFFSIY